VTVLARGTRAGLLVVAGGSSAYLALPFWRAGQEGLEPRHWWRIPVAVAVKDLSQLAGAALGLSDRIRRRPSA
jgi:hypothetical protein